MEGKTSIILLVIVGLLSLALAATAIGFFILGGGGNNSKDPQIKYINPSDQLPDETNGATYPLYGEKGSATLKLFKTEVTQIGVIMVDIEFLYWQKVDGVTDPKGVLDFYVPQIQQEVSDYFMKMTLSDASNPQMKEKAAKELKDKINQIINPEKKAKKDIIAQVIFKQWFPQ